MTPFKPKGPQAVVSEKEFQKFMIETVEPELDDCMTEGFLTVKGGEKIYYNIYDCESPVAAVTILHGFTESLVKFREMIWHFLNRGVKVFCIDHRGHGRSHRVSDDTELTHIDRFSDYIDDLKEFCDNVVIPGSEGLPRSVLGHSMGGCITAHFISIYPDVFEKAVLSSPMIRPLTAGIPMGISKFIVRAACKTGKGTKKLFGHHGYDEAENFADSCDTCEERFNYYRDLRRKHPYLRNTYPSYGWLDNSLRVDRFLLKNENCERVKADVLLYQAGLDKVVSNKYEDMYIAKIKGAKKLVAPTAKHEIYMSDTKTLNIYYNDIFGFLGV